jgi:hypothetical protein
MVSPWAKMVSPARMERGPCEFRMDSISVLSRTQESGDNGAEAESKEELDAVEQSFMSSANPFENIVPLLVRKNTETSIPCFEFAASISKD